MYLSQTDVSLTMGAADAITPWWEGEGKARLRFQLEYMGRLTGLRDGDVIAVITP
jgi:hypothetical protein